MSGPLHHTEVHLDSVLSTFARLYMNDEFVYSRVLSMIKVTKASDKYVQYSKADTYAQADQSFISGGQANEIGVRLTLDGSYSTQEYGLAGYVLDRTVRNADNPIQPRMDTTRLLVNQLMLGRERRVANVIFNAASYATGHSEALSGTNQWGNAAADPIGDIQTMLSTSLRKPNVLVFGKLAWDAFRGHEKVLRALSGAALSTGVDPAGGLAKRSDVAALFEVDRVEVGEARYTDDVFQANAVTNLQYIWGKHVAALYVEPSVTGPDVLTHAGLFYTMPIEVQSTYVLQRKGEYLLACWDEDVQVIANDVGYLLRNVIP